MLTKRQNVLEVVKGGNPDRFVNQYEAFELVRGRPGAPALPPYGGDPVVDDWGVTEQWPIGLPAGFPIHDEEHIVVKDIENWRDYVTAPNVIFPDAAWERMIANVEAVDRTDKFALAFYRPGIFERIHYLCEIQNALVYFYENPDELKELIKYVTDYELRLAEQIIDHTHPDGVFRHDDWGTQISTFVSPAMFDEFLLEPCKEVYGYWISRGCDMIVHHSDSFAATIVPEMVEMGIKVWQGVISTNDIPSLIQKYCGKIAFMGGIDSAAVDIPDWTPEIVEAEVRRVCSECGPLGFIPSCTNGTMGSVHKGVYETVTEVIEKINQEQFGIKD